MLVLGVGGNVSQGILKAIAAGALECRVVAACVTPFAAGLFAADRSYVSPLADAPDFIDWVEDICHKEQVGAVLSGVEPVLARLSEASERLRENTGAVCLVSEPGVLAIGQDKLETCRWLKARGLPHPRFTPVEDRTGVEALAEECGLPLIVKPRRGKSAQGVELIESASAIPGLGAAKPDHVVQERLPDDEGEFTAGSFCDGDGVVRGVMVMRRHLQGGTTVRATAGSHPEIADEVARIVGALGPMGPCNVQLRLVDGRPVPFELNVRFSGTSPVRARLGFNEVEAALRHFVLGEPAQNLPAVEAGTVLRYWNEMYIDEDAVRRLEATGELADPRAGLRSVEPWGSD